MTERVVDFRSGSCRVKHAVYQDAMGWVFVLWPDGGFSDRSVSARLLGKADLHVESLAPLVSDGSPATKGAQQCPRCHGAGDVSMPGDGLRTVVCPVCKGRGFVDLDRIA